jgi:hypothetical protein
MLALSPIAEPAMLASRPPSRAAIHRDRELRTTVILDPISGIIAVSVFVV